MAHCWRRCQPSFSVFRAWCRADFVFLNNVRDGCQRRMLSVPSVRTQKTLTSWQEVEPRLRETIFKHWGIKDLHPRQVDVMRVALEGRDAFIMLPTGWGKSLCYQAPALLREGLTVVVSPLISLMKDQVDGLRQIGVPAGYLASTLDLHEKEEIRASLRQRTLKLLYVSPEQLHRGFIGWLYNNGLEAVAIDEAHCISYWGMDFRPEYRQLNEIRDGQLHDGPHVPVHAFTATATEWVQHDIQTQLGLEDPVHFVAGVDRPNLNYRILLRLDILQQVLEVISRHQGSCGIVYCQTRAEVETLHQQLEDTGMSCLKYHAGLSPAERSRTSEAFKAGESAIILATVAFGMGVDRADVRFVVHTGLPEGIDQYVHECGRAGRDRLPSECVMLFNVTRDLQTRLAFIKTACEHQEESLHDAALKRLNDILGYATGLHCRHQMLADHYGQSLEIDRCGACDVCLGEQVPLPNSLATARTILRAVRGLGRHCSVAHVADVLTAVTNPRIQKLGHAGNKYYGSLRQHNRVDVAFWIEQLVNQGFLDAELARYRKIALTPEGVALITSCSKAQQKVCLWQPQVPVRHANRKRRNPRPSKCLATPGHVQDVDKPLFEKLCALRRELASEDARPAYFVCTNTTLTELTLCKPRDLEGLLEIHGFGERRVARYGNRFLDAIADN